MLARRSLIRITFSSLALMMSRFNALSWLFSIIKNKHLTRHLPKHAVAKHTRLPLFNKLASNFSVFAYNFPRIFVSTETSQLKPGTSVIDAFMATVLKFPIVLIFSPGSHNTQHLLSISLDFLRPGVFDFETTSREPAQINTHGGDILALRQAWT